MKIERINETQVKCTLTSFDLSIRNVDIRELTYGSQKARDLFSEMMQKAMQELGFETDGCPVMVEAIPLRDESIVLVITRVEEPDEIDTRFSRFSPEMRNGASGPEGLFDFAKAVPDPQNKLQATPENGTMRTFVFNNLDEAIEAARATDNRFHGRNSLYKDPTSNKYYLAMEEIGADNTMYLSTCNVLSEHGRMVVQNIMGVSYMREHYELIIGGNALDALLNI